MQSNTLSHRGVPARSMERGRSAGRRSYAAERILDYYPNLRYKQVVNQLRWSTYVSFEKRYIYSGIPKCAYSTMKEVLLKVEGLPPARIIYGPQWQSRRDMFIHHRGNVPLPSLMDFDNAAQKEILESPDFFRVTIGRNPYKRLISAWKDKALLCEPPFLYLYQEIKGRLPELTEKTLISFEEFLDYVQKCDLATCDPHWQRQVDRVYFKALNFSHIGKVENFSETLQLFQLHLGITEPLAVERKNVSGATRSAEFTASMADRIYTLYQDDFAAFGYDRNSWPQSQPETPMSAMVSEEKFTDEIIERNIIISHLYQERERLKAQLGRTLPGIVRRAYEKVERLCTGREYARRSFPHLGSGRSKQKEVSSS